MGVQGLWKLLEPTGKPIPVERLNDLILGVDVSIWMYQIIKGVQKNNQGATTNKHLLVMFHRICKLLFYGIKPIFVFDGGVPELKKITIAKRQAERSRAIKSSGKATEELLKNILQQAALKSVTNASEALTEDEVISKAVNSLNKETGVDMFELPSLPETFEIEKTKSPVKEKEQSYVKAENILLLAVENQENDIMNGNGAKDKAKPSPEKLNTFSSMQIGELLNGYSEDQRRSSERKKQQKSKHEMTLNELEMFLNDNNDAEKNINEFSQKIDSDHDTVFYYESDVKKAAKSCGSPEKNKTPKEEIEKEKTVEPESEKESQKLITTDTVGSPTLTSDVKKAAKSCGSPEKNKTPKEEIETEKTVEPESEKESQKLITTDTVGSPTQTEDMDEDIFKALAGDESLEEDRLAWLTFNENKRASKRRSSEFESPNSKYLKLDTNNKPSENTSDKEDDMENTSDKEEDVENTSDKKENVENTSDKKEGVENTSDKEEDVENTSDKKENVENTSDKKENVENTSEKEEDVENNKSPPKKFIDESIFLSPVDNIFHGFKLENYDPDNIIAWGKPIYVGQENLNVSPSNKALWLAKQAEIEAERRKNTPIKPIKPKTPSTWESILEIDAVEYEPLDIPPRSPFKSDSDDESSTDYDAMDEYMDAQCKSSCEGWDPSIPLPKKDKNRKTVITENCIDAELLKPHETEINDLDEEYLSFIQDTLVEKQNDLASLHSRSERMSSSVTQKVISEIKCLLKLFGIPYITAPMEAEAQCIFLERNGFTHGTITDDSDAWLFGANIVYKDFFDSQQYVKEFRSYNIAKKFTLTQRSLIQMALLVGSDYTNGIDGIGPVTAIEIISFFETQKLSLVEKLLKIKEVVNSGSEVYGDLPFMKKLKSAKIGSDFPNKAVINAYMYPIVDKSKIDYKWEAPQVDSIVEFAQTNFDWDVSKTMNTLAPVLKKVSTRSATQTSLDLFWVKKNLPTLTNTNSGMSKRVSLAVKRMRNDQSSVETSNANSDNSERLTSTVRNDGDKKCTENPK